MVRRLFMCASALALMFASAANAQDLSEGVAASDAWYVGVTTGASWPETSGLQGAAAGRFENDDPEVFGLVAIGRGMRGWRGELEGGWRQSDLGGLDGVPGTNGELTQFTAMINIVRDLAPFAAVRPFLGAGVGIAVSELEFNAPLVDVEDEDTAFAAQAIAGVAFKLTPNVALDVGYRYFWTDAADFGPVSFRNDFDRHEATVGLRFGFGAMQQPQRDTVVVVQQQPPQTQPPPPVIVPAPVPPPAPPPPSCPSTETEIYFGFDSATVDAQSRASIQNEVNQPAANCRRTFVVVGHTDSAGSQAYNERLALRRARAVQSVLISLGVPASEIRVESAGQRDLAVPTGDDVREPRNRRVVIRTERTPLTTAAPMGGPETRGAGTGAAPGGAFAPTPGTGSGTGSGTTPGTGTGTTPPGGSGTTPGTGPTTPRSTLNPSTSGTTGGVGAIGGSGTTGPGTGVGAPGGTGTTPGTTGSGARPPGSTTATPPDMGPSPRTGPSSTQTPTNPTEEDDTVEPEDDETGTGTGSSTSTQPGPY